MTIKEINKCNSFYIFFFNFLEILHIWTCFGVVLCAANWPQFDMQTLQERPNLKVQILQTVLFLLLLSIWKFNHYLTMRSLAITNNVASAVVVVLACSFFNIFIFAAICNKNKFISRNHSMNILNVTHIVTHSSDSKRALHSSSI